MGGRALGKIQTRRRAGIFAPLRTLTVLVIALSLVTALQSSVTLEAIAAAQQSVQTISPTTCDYSTKTDYFCSLPPGSTIKLPMSAPAIVPPPGWHCIAGIPPTHIAYYSNGGNGPSPTADMSVQWVAQSGGACGAVSGYALVTVGAKATPQYLAADFFLANDVGECNANNTICANGIADNGTRWSLNVTLPQYILKFNQQVTTSSFPQGTTPYVFPDYPPAASPTPSTNAATVTCTATTKVLPTQGQISYSGNVSCNSPNGIVGRIAFNVYRIWQDRTDSDGGGVFLCSQQTYQSSCQTPTYTFQTYGNNPAVYKVAIDVNLLNSINGEGLPGGVIQNTGTNYQMVPYNNTQAPYPLMNPDGWNSDHLPFPDIETLPSFTYCPTTYQGSPSYPQCSAYNTPLLRKGAITTYPQKGHMVPKGITGSSSGQYATQYIKPIECGGTAVGTNGAFLKPGQASQLSLWWSNFWPCAPQPPTVHWQVPKPNFSVDQGDHLKLTASTQPIAGITPTVTFSASWPGYASPTQPSNHWFTVATVPTPSAGTSYTYDWNLQTPGALTDMVPTGPITIRATACTGNGNCSSTYENGQVRKRLFLFALGLSAADNPGDNGFSSLENKLTTAYPDSSVQLFQYPCSNTSLCYTPEDTCTHTLGSDVNTMAAQIQRYASQHTNTDIYVIGDSLGGATTFGYLGSLKSMSWAPLPNGGKIDGISTFDAPLGGIPTEDMKVTTIVFDSLCFGSATPYRTVTPLQNLNQVAATDALAAGSTANMMHVTFPGTSLPPNYDNQRLAQEAAAHGIRVFSVGNLKDYGFAISGCILFHNPLTGLVDYTASEFLTDSPSNSVYSRYISRSSSGNCFLDSVSFQVNHALTMQDPSVATAMVNFIGGKAPAPLPSFP